MKLLRRLARWLGIIVLVLAVLIVAAVGVLHTEWGREQVRAQIEQALDERIAGDVSIGRLEGSVLGNLIARDVTVRNRAGQPVITLDTLRVDFELLPLLSQHFEARQVTLLGLEVVDRGALGALWQPPGDEPTAWTVDLERIQLREGSYVRRRPGAAPAHVRGIALDAALAAADAGLTVDLARATGTWVGGDVRGNDLRARIEGHLEVIDGRLIATGVSVSAGASRIAVPAAVASTDGQLLAGMFRAEIASRDVDRFAPQLQWRAPLDVVGAVARDGAGAPLHAWLRGQVGPAELVGAATIDGRQVAADLRVRDLQPQRLTPRAPPGRVDLQLALRGRGSSLETLDGRLRIDASGSIAGISASSLSGTADIEDGQLQLELRAPRLLAGKVRVGGLAVEARATELFDDGAAGRATVTADDIAGPGFSASDLRASADLSSLSLDGKATLRARADDLIAVGERIGRVRLDARLRDRGKRVRGTLRAGDPDAPYRGRIPFVATTEESGEGRRRIELTIPDARVRTRELDWTGTAAATVGPGSQLRVKRLRLASEAGTLEAEGTLRSARKGRLRFEARDLDLAELWAALPAALDVPALRGRAQASGEVSLDPLRLDLRASGRRIAWTSEMPPIDAGVRAEIGDDLLEATMSAQARNLGSATLELELGLPPEPLSPASWRRYRTRGIRTARLALRNLHVGRIAELADTEARELGLAGRARGVIEVSDGGDDISADLRLSGARGGPLRSPIDLHLEGTSSASLTKATVEIELGGRDLGTARLTLGRGLAALWREGARAPERIPVDGTLEVPGVPLRRLTTALEVDAELSGLLCARVQLDGTLGAPSVRGRVELVDAEWRMTDLRFASITGRWRGGRWNAEARAFQRDGGSLRAMVTGGAGRALEGQLSARALDLAVLSPMLRAADVPIYSVDGELGGEVILRDQTASGTLTVRNGQLRMVTGLHRVTGLELTANFGPRLVTVKGKGRTGAGTLALDATAALPEDGLMPERVAAVLELDDSPILAGNVRATASAEIRVAGTRRDELWRMDVAVSDGRVQLPSDFRGSELHSLSDLEDVRYASELRAKDPAEAPLGKAREPGVRAHVYTTEPIRIRGDADIEARASADLDVTLLGGATVVDGGVELVSGTVSLFDRKYRVVRAGVRFEGRSPPNPSLDVLLEHAFEQVTLQIAVSGTLDEPSIELSSQPGTYSRSELLGFVLGGTPGTAPRSEDKLQQSAIGAASSFLAGQLETLIRRRVPFDTIRLGAEPGADTATGVSYVTVGRWVSDDLFVAYHRRFEADPDENLNEALLEYQLTDRWTVRGAAGDRGAAHVDLLWVRRYD